MNREIKFRAWRKDKKEMSYFHLTQGDGYGVGGEVFPEYEIMQFTGLRDKNGKEIYENDLIKSPSHNPPVMQIEFIEGGFCATSPKFEGFPIDINHFYPSVGTDIEIIGNIYEHNELLK